VLAGRYRLRTELPPVDGDPDEVQRWLAVDDVLARPVDVLVLLAAGKRAPWGRDLLEAAAAAGTVAHPVPVSVYDAALEEVPAERYGRAAGQADVAYVVTEHVHGTTLADRLDDDGPLEPAEALDLALQAAEALKETHARGVVHGALSPSAVVLPAEGGIRLRDTAVGAALAERTEASPPPGESPADDVRALGACLYAMLTARWPADATPAPAAGLPAAPRTGGRGHGDGRLCTPRQVRAGVPRHLDAAVMRVLGAGPTTTGKAATGKGASGRPVETADELLKVLRGAADADAAAHAPVPRPRRAPRLPPVLARRLPLVAAVALLVVVALVGYVQGRELGTVQREGTELEALVDSTPSPVPGDDGSGQRIDLVAPGRSVVAFDPPPGDGAENNAAVPNVTDGDPGTAWETERYDTSRLGGLKPGVGLLVDLGEPVAVQQVEIGVSPGVDVELRAADEPFPDIESFPVVAAAEETENVVRLVPEAPVTARFFVVWLTRLPPESGGFRGSVRELFFVQP
jgi:hypothetical protein